MKLDLLIIDLMGGDIEVTFVQPDLFDEFLWIEETPEEHINRVCNLLNSMHGEENKDTRIIKTIYSQTFTDGEIVNLKNIDFGRVMNLEAQ